MTPGEYLARRRTAAGMLRVDVAQALAALPWAIKPASEADVVRLEQLLESVEADRTLLTRAQAELLASVIRFDLSIYLQLVERPNSGLGPMICRDCACSWCDPCQHEDGRACAWSEISDGDAGPLCSRCAEIARATAELVAAPLRHLRAVRTAAERELSEAAA